jgi:hypothetical protein
MRISSPRTTDTDPSVGLQLTANLLRIELAPVGWRAVFTRDEPSLWKHQKNIECYDSCLSTCLFKLARVTLFQHGPVGHPVGKVDDTVVSSENGPVGHPAALVESLPLKGEVGGNWPPDRRNRNQRVRRRVRRAPNSRMRSPCPSTRRS